MSKRGSGQVVPDPFFMPFLTGERSYALSSRIMTSSPKIEVEAMAT
jgi:hypothetical protein